MLGHFTYLIFELGWALPVLMLQWAVGWRELWPQRRTLVLVIALPTAYLCVADAVAITAGIWTLHGNRITGLRFGVLPIEEGIFFLVTNTIVAQAVVLVAARGWATKR